VAKFATEIVWTAVPRSVLGHIRALLRKIIKALRGSSEILLSMCVVAVRPLVLLVYKGAECRFVKENHKTLNLAILV
jgi:hypothetical protein